MPDLLLSESEFTVSFAGEGLVRAEALAESLVGWSGIYGRVPSVLAQKYNGFRDYQMLVFVEAIDQGSLIAKIWARLVAKSDEAAEQMERDIDRLANDAVRTLLTNIKRMNDPGKKILTAAVGGVITLGALNMMGYLDDQQQVAINNSTNAIINQGAIYFSTTPAEFMGMVSRATRDNVTLTKQTMAALRPAAALTDGTVQIGDAGNNIIVTGAAAKVVASMSSAQLEPRLETRHLTNAAISIRALDLDRKTSGWAAVIPDLSPRRVRLTLHDSVNISTPGTYIANVDVDVLVDLDGTARPKSAHVLSALAPGGAGN